MDIFTNRGLRIIDFEHFLLSRKNGVKIFDIVKNQPKIFDQLAHEIEIEWINKIEHEHYQKLDKPLDGTISILKLVKEITPISIISARQNHELLCQSAYDNFGIEREKVLSVNPLLRDVAVEKSKLLNSLKAIGFIGDSHSDKKAASLSNIPFLHSSYLDTRSIKKWLDKLNAS